LFRRFVERHQTPWASLASLQYMMGQAHEAKLSMERALASAEKTYGPVHPMIADLLESDAVILDKLKLKKDARQARARARKIRGAGTNPADDRLAWSIREVTPVDQVHLRSK